MGQLIKSLEELELIVRKHKRVVTTGAFDVPHVGHTRYLDKAKSLGDELILILHSDKLISLRKGPDRPIYAQDVRIQRMVSERDYACVDYVYLAITQADVYEAILASQASVLVTSETTKDVENSPDTMMKLFGNSMKVVTLEAQAAIHSTDIIASQGLVKP